MTTNIEIQISISGSTTVKLPITYDHSKSTGSTTIDWGDGSLSTVLTSNTYNGSAFSSEVQHEYDGNTTSPTISIIDGTGITKYGIYGPSTLDSNVSQFLSSIILFNYAVKISTLTSFTYAFSGTSVDESNVTFSDGVLNNVFYMKGMFQNASGFNSKDYKLYLLDYFSFSDLYLSDDFTDSELVWYVTKSNYFVNDLLTAGMTQKKLLATGEFGTEIGKNNVVYGGGNLVNNNKLSANNTALGVYALRENTAKWNTGVGAYALASSTSGIGNTSIGTNSARDLSGGSFNTALGTSAMRKNVNGSHNVSIGSNAMEYNINGSSNIAIGTQSMFTTISGGSNISIGNNCMKNMYIGNANVIIGNDCDVADVSGTYTNSISIGNNITIDDDNIVKIGNSSTENTYFNGFLHGSGDTLYVGDISLSELSSMVSALQSQGGGVGNSLTLSSLTVTQNASLNTINGIDVEYITDLSSQLNTINTTISELNLSAWDGIVTQNITMNDYSIVYSDGNTINYNASSNQLNVSGSHLVLDGAHDISGVQNLNNVPTSYFSGLTDNIQNQIDGLSGGGGGGGVSQNIICLVYELNESQSSTSYVYMGSGAGYSDAPMGILMPFASTLKYVTMKVKDGGGNVDVVVEEDLSNIFSFTHTGSNRVVKSANVSLSAGKELDVKVKRTVSSQAAVQVALFLYIDP